MASKRSLLEHFVITDYTGTPVFDVHGNPGLTQRLTMRDQAGQELAEIRKHLMTTTHEILVGGQPPHPGADAVPGVRRPGGSQLIMPCAAFHFWADL